MMILKDSLAMSYKVRHKPTLRPSISSPRYLPKRSENIGLQKDFNNNAYNNLYIIYKNQDQSKCLSRDKWKTNLLSNKKE